MVVKLCCTIYNLQLYYFKSIEVQNQNAKTGQNKLIGRVANLANVLFELNDH